MDTDAKAGQLRGITRGSFVSGAAAVSVGMLGAACSPAATPQATTTAPAPGKAPWEEEWDRLVAAAKQEGKLSMLILSGPGYQKGIETFEAAFPGIKVEQESFTSASLWIPKVTEERKAGVFSRDIINTPVQSVLIAFRSTGGLDPIRPAIFRPDVLDDKAWRDGFEAGLVDKDKQLSYLFAEEVLPRFIIDSNQVKEGEIKSARDLLDPKWKGRIFLADVRTGNTFPLMVPMRQNLGDDAVKRLMVDQQPVFSRDFRQIIEAIVRGRYAIGNSGQPAILKEFQDQGLGKNVKSLDLPDAAATASSGGLFLVNRAPHPNAAKLFINWVLTKEGQSAWCVPNRWNSRRLDVPPGDPDAVPKPGVKYFAGAREESLAAQEETRKFLETLVQ